MFSEYEHMENHYNLGKILDIKAIDPHIHFVCTEKIHGTNYSFLCDRDTYKVTPCKRSSVLGENESFMGHQKIYNKYKDEIVKILKELENQYQDIKSIQLFGELFGGGYDGKSAKDAKKIQKGVNYHNDNEFMAYDLKITLNNKTFYYDFNKLVQLMENSNIKLVPIIFRGSLEEVLKLDPAFQSTVYSYFGLNKMKNESELVSEGYVVHPIIEMNFPESSRRPNDRFIFKFKNPIFSETLPATTQTNIKTAVSKAQNIDLLRNYLTQNRYDNVISKLTDDEKSQIKKVHKMLYDDVLTDFKTDNDGITEEDLKIYEKQLNGFVFRFLHENK